MGSGYSAARISATGAHSAVFGLADEDVLRIKAATGVTPETQRRMTWTRFAGSALPERAVCECIGVLSSPERVAGRYLGRSAAVGVLGWSS
jgi:hypothetical protein